MEWTDLVNESLSNLSFYSHMVDQLKERLDSYQTIQMYNRARNSKKKCRFADH